MPVLLEDWLLLGWQSVSMIKTKSVCYIDISSFLNSSFFALELTIVIYIFTYMYVYLHINIVTYYYI